MFYKVKVKDFIRVPPHMFHLKKNDAVLQNVKATYENFISKELGFVMNVIDVYNVEEGVIVPGDGAGFYETEFDLLTYKPELNELVFGKIRDITDFGAFIDIGGVEGMVHISQSMDDFVSFSKEKVLMGKNTNRSIKVGDKCKARIIAISYKDLNNPKIGLTMRQEGLGKLEWLSEEQSNKVASSSVKPTDSKPKEAKKAE
ncbi:DNA-directed RNA polymerase [Candidatus Woesearchaeota archaeon CG10_big_fil_rev_8_21_14_0_10_32_24]|nr:MAG: DNA-directed RNA polymerase [Candidatus Woesearchaeota archaeon CG10_big_fil_rev_8_21_14_0_10_32_24]